MENINRKNELQEIEGRIKGKNFGLATAYILEYRKNMEQSGLQPEVMFEDVSNELQESYVLKNDDFRISVTFLLPTEDGTVTSVYVFESLSSGYLTTPNFFKFNKNEKNSIIKAMRELKKRNVLL